MSSVKLSVLIITYNEEENIRRCIQSLKSVADEIVIVDSFSTDKTEQICKELGVTFIQNPFEGHIQQKNYAVSQATYEHVLSLDADEALTEELQEAIRAVKEDWQKDAYSFNRLTSYCGHWVRHCGWYPDKKIRLWNRDAGHWGGENPHDRVEIKHGAHTGWLKGDLLHYSFPTIASHVNTANSFSEIASKEAFKKGKKANTLVHIILNPLFTFFSKYILKAGFLDGYYGFVICVLSAYANFLKYTKIKELHRKNG